MNDEPVIALDRLTKRYGDFTAVRELSLAISRGTIFGFLGANGAGKTTTIRMLCGLTSPTSGSARIAGFDVWRQRQGARSKFGYLAQRFSLYRDLTVRENFRFFGGAYGVPRAELERRIPILLGLIDLEAKADTTAGSLSGGMRQLLALGCALVHDPPLLFLDEPTSGLDPIGAGEFDDLIATLQRTLGLTVFMVTHDLDSLYSVCDRIAALGEGKILAEGPIEAMLASDHPWLRSYFHGKRARAVMTGGA
jgi:phospholipid/cholesterol/gamma-HCH transport system ATP-binding protein